MNNTIENTLERMADSVRSARIRLGNPAEEEAKLLRKSVKLYPVDFEGTSTPKMGIYFSEGNYDTSCMW
ncbi:MAG: hypothetical protein KKA62_02620 [Nanoarchaeota archaeon]|nr:hypothetical protein [Nanoarchaeota archaeon]MBU1643615.1 hypothetical protein [Nanoarchaeota archaeon]MBU1976825.1 hypothetical protein [Nanoarchaeota archaeon]